MALNYNIGETVFGDFFSKDDQVKLLDEYTSSSIWQKYIDKTAANYFRLKDDHWIVKAKSEKIAYWMDDFNREDPRSLKKIFDTQLTWEDNNIVWFCINSSTVLESRWSEFKLKWISFLYCEDECPFVINAEFPDEMLIFTPVGDLVLVKRE